MTGINPWWTYEEGPAPGAGKWMVNVATGNLIVQEDDVDIPERGIDLAFRRTYNSLSEHDYAGTDGSTPSNYGNGWTNTFDAHLGYNASTNIITVWDIDGARYDYTSNGSGGWNPPPGQHAILQWDGGCGYFWTKKSGTRYHFWSPYAVCSNPQGYWGRLYMIQARNHNNYIQFNYYWDNGDASTSAHLNQINAVHADGQSLMLKFADFSGYRELASLTRPDGAQITYAYDGLGDSIEADELPNTGTTAPRKVQYGYWTGGYRLRWVLSPRWVQQTGGGYVRFAFDSSARLSSAGYVGIMNFTPNDNTGQPIQGSYPTSGAAYLTEQFTYPSAGETQSTDTDGHATNWFYDGAGRSTETQGWTGAPNNLWLTTYASWDANNNLAESVDARGNPTNYGYDGNGNVLWVQQPQVTTSLGSGRPVARYSYDQFNNLIAYCDPQYIWTTGATSCPAANGATHYTWNYSDANEPYGYLTDTYTPLGYHRAISYNTGAEGGGDYGLPTTVQGDPYTQADGTVRQPTQTFTYNGYGDLVSYNKGNGVWRLTYDALNRLLISTDPDNISSYTCYYRNGQVQYTESAAQHALDGSPSSCQGSAPTNAVAYTYDADGNDVSETHHYGGAAGVTQKWYDGADRLVEVEQPRDPNGNDYYTYAWMTRYIYDLTQGSNVSVDGASFRAYGNLYKTQEYLPGNPIVQAGVTPAAPQWMDVRGTSFDALDRALASYENSFGTVPKLTNTYDTNGNYGLLSHTQNAVGQQSTLTYYGTGALYQKQYQNDGGVTPWMTYTYDPDGRPTSVNSSQFGAENHTFDADGRLVTVAEPQGGGYTSPATISYAYYGDGLRKDLSVSSSAFSQSNLFQYSYRADGLLQKQGVNASSGGGTFAWTYTNAGRELTQSDPFAGKVITLYNGQDAATGTTRTLQAKTYTYDVYGRIASLVLPEGYTYNSFTYDPEGETTAYARSNAWCDYGMGGRLTDTTCMGNRGQAYSVRAELTKVTDSAAGAGAGNGPSANGTIVTGTTKSFDARSGMVLDMISQDYSTDYNVTGSLNYAHDAAGRQTTVTENYTYYTAQTAYVTRGYDAENHVVSQSYTGADFYCADSLTMCGGQQVGGKPAVESGTATTYGWGPNGHPILLKQLLNGSPYKYGGWEGMSTLSVHWDGDDVLFVAAGGGVDLEVGKLAAADGTNLTNLTVIDRDMTGSEVATHTATAFSAWSSAPPTKTYRPICSSGCKVQTALVSGAINSNNDQYGPATQYLSSGRTDGYDDGYGNTFQGVRAYDENTSQWTAPDAYAGDVRDPMSQKPYMWNRNNPIDYSDPSGYDPYIISDPSAAMGFGHLEIAIIDPKTRKGIVWSQGPVHDGDFSDRQVITQRAISIADISAMQGKGDGVLTEHTTRAQDSAMTKVARQRFATQSKKRYNALTNNCAQFVQQVLRAADPATASQMSNIPNQDYSILVTAPQGLSRMGDPPKAANPIKPN